MTAPRIRTIDLGNLDPVARRAVTRRSALPDLEIRAGAAAICADVARRGDGAVEEAGRRYGGNRPAGMVVDSGELARALRDAPKELVAALDEAMSNVETYHRSQVPRDQEVETVPGVRLARRWTPLDRVGCYVPGGKAAYPSSLIMTVVPARIAGVGEVVVASPADREGSLSPALLTAAAMLEVDEMYAMGGAQAIAALAYGTETIRPVDKIVGPGNAWVTAAKLAVLGVCAIDLPAGPSEVLVLADGSADPLLVAIDLLCQAEHGPDSPAVLLTTDAELGKEVIAEIGRLVPHLERGDVLATALSDHGLVVLAPDHDTAIAFADEYAAEHVSVLTADPETDAKRITGAGSVYVGRWSPESAGDYATGANHVLPTGGLARAAGPLCLEDFGSWRQVQTISQEGLTRLRPTIVELAGSEGLSAHRLAAELRFEDGRI